MFKKKGVPFTKQDIEQRSQKTLPWMYYFQLRSIFSREDFQEDLKKENTPFEQLLALKDDSMKHKLSMLYTIFFFLILCHLLHNLLNVNGKKSVTPLLTKNSGSQFSLPW